MDEDKRRNLRLSIDIPVKIRFNGITIPGKSINLSCGGIFVQAPQIMEPKDSCELILHLPDGLQPMVVNSEVVWLKNDPSMDAVAMPEDKVDEQSLREIQSGNVNALQETVDFSETTNESTSDASDAQEEASAEDTEFGGAGLRFAGMDGDQKERINEFIRRNIRQDLH